MNSPSELAHVIKEFERWLAQANRQHQRDIEQARWEYNTVQNALYIVRRDREK